MLISGTGISLPPASTANFLKVVAKLKVNVMSLSASPSLSMWI